MQNLKFAAVNFRSEFGEIQKNLDRIENWVSKLQSKGAQVIGFPEMSICGYSRSEAIIPHLQNMSGSVVNTLREIAVRYDVLILAGLATQNQHGERFISQVAVSPQRDSLFYHKVHLSPTEATFYTPGEEVSLFSYLGWQIGLQLCYDSHFPEMSTLLALQGADVLFIGYASPHETVQIKCERLVRFLSARAYDNSCYLVSCNLSGFGDSGQVFPGGALAFSPKGKLIANACEQNEDFLLIELDPSSLERIRSTKMGHFLSRRRPDFYKGLFNDNYQEPLQD